MPKTDWEEDRGLLNKASTISGDNFNDMITASDSVTNSLRISYGGTIGLSYGGRNFSFAMWETDLMGLDASKYKNIVLRIRGQKGGEQPNIYLDDACRRACLRPQDFRPISDTWQDLRLPLRKFTDLGIDITNLDKLQITFEWKEMSDTIYLNEIYFE